MRNPWRFCDTEPPPQYTRVEIKSRNRQVYVGYRYKKQYYETIGNSVIPDPFKWRYIPVGSYLWNEIVNKIRSLSIEEEVGRVHGNQRE